jgi:hypothetical protein
MGGAGSRIWQALSEAGVLPAGEGPSIPAPPEGPAEDLLPLAIRAWQRVETAHGPANSNRATRLAQRFQAWQQQGAHLTLGVPGTGSQAVNRWLGLRLVWWPRGIPPGRRVALVSSRLGRDLDHQTTWFTVLRAACAKIDRQRDLLLWATSTTTAQYVKRAASLFGLRVLQIEVPQDDTQPLENWLDRLETTSGHGADQFYEAVLSPPIDTQQAPSEAAVCHIPLRDRAVVALGDQIMAFRVRRNGHVHQLMRARLSDAGWPVASVYIALGPELVRTEMAGELMEQGAVGWVVLGTIGETPDARGRAVATGIGSQVGSRSARAAAGAAADEAQLASGRIVLLPPSDDWPYLTHCTRRRDGPWPQQDEAEHIDDLILARPDADHSALSTLRRILEQRRLIAMAEAIRGATRVVSFTAVPLAELRRLRVFRPHRGRWDFEPYGICIRRDWLEGCGVRHVVYGDDPLWEDLSPDDRPFFQLRRTRRPAARGSIDWAVEDEWRVVGDVDLSQIPRDAAMVFVPSRAEAQVVAGLSRWPVTVVSR